jgi:hypothetical protein
MKAHSFSIVGGLFDIKRYASEFDIWSKAELEICSFLVHFCAFFVPVKDSPQIERSKKQRKRRDVRRRQKESGERCPMKTNDTTNVRPK